LVPNHNIENDKQFTHTGSDNHFVGFTLLFESLGKFSNYGIKATGVLVQREKDKRLSQLTPNLAFGKRFFKA